MIRHVVSWKLAAEDTATKAEQSAQIAAALQTLPPVIPEIQSLTVASNSVDVEGNWDVVLIADYADEAALRTYIDHPEHQKVAGFIRTLVAQRSNVDVTL
ncbi:Dabb family protein [Lacisediminihabitans changchengi]|uniref:Dabb family protein n=1 Tax=Lacisediminihabitans changchengi TaxID=2787634 RepID=A0A934SVX9_9MICO|nr:Dabb family protein [Lacisediminihabitans changchengi]MBK4349004.1 Dabb family protein [Lacisediminihabitans changchengi]